MTDEQSGGPVSAAAPAPRPVSARRITRSRRHKVVGGVCGGLGRYFDLDPVMFRVPLAVMSLIGGVGLFAYGVAWLVMPFEDEEENEGRRMLSGRVDGPGLTALVTVVVGCGLMLASLPGRTSFFSVMLLGMLVAAGYWSRYRRTGGAAGPTGLETDRAAAQALASAPPEVQAPPAPNPPSWWREAGHAAEEERYLWGPADAATSEGPARSPAGPPASREAVDGGPPAAGPSRASTDGAEPPGAPERRTVTIPEPARPFWLGGPVLLGAAVAGGVVTVAVWNSAPLGTVLVYGLAAALAVSALGLVVGAFWGRIGTGTIINAMLISLLMVGAAALPDTIPTERLDERWMPQEVADVAPRYEVGTGEGRLDLSAVELGPEERLGIEAEAGAGQFRVVIPHDALVEVSTHVWLGAYEYEEPREETTGPSVSGAGFRTDWTGSFGPPPGRDSHGVVELDMTMGVGVVVVERAPAPDAEEDVAPAEEPGDVEADARGLYDPRGLYDARGLHDARGTFDAREEVAAP